MPNIDLSILNQRQTPAFYADVFANRPAAGFIGRIFVSTNTFAFYRDNGTSWDLIGGPGTGTVTGTGANGQVTYWNGASTITGSNDLFFDAVNGHLGIGTITPGTALDVKHDQSTVVQLEQVTATNDIRIAFINSGVGLWRLGSFYNAGANDFGLFDIAAATQPVTVKRTTGQVLIGTSTVGSGKLVVASTTGDNGVQIVGASAPSLRIDNAESGPTKRAGFGISTATNNFIQGSADRDFCMFNGSTTASPILFGIYDTTNVQEAARISAARNFLIGTTTDGGQKLQVNGGVRATGYFLDGMTAGSGALYWTSNRVTLANYNASGTLLFEVNGGAPALSIDANRISTFVSTGGNGLRVYGGSGTNQWDMYLSGANLRIGDNTGGGNVQIDSNVTINTSLSPFGSQVNALQMPQGVALYAWNASAVPQLYLGANNYFDGSNFKYIISGQSVSLYYQANGAHIWYNAGSGTAGNNISLSQPMTLAATGNLLIGTTTDNGNKLRVNGSQYIDGFLTINNIGANVPALYVTQQGNLDDAVQINMTNINTYAIKFLWYGTNMAGIQVNVAGTAVAYNTTFSDINKKKNFENWNENILDLFKNINPKKFNFISEDNSAEKTKGFIAQELVDKFPEAYPINDEGFYTFNPSGMVTYLMKAIQELNTKIENIK